MAQSCGMPDYMDIICKRIVAACALASFGIILTLCVLGANTTAKAEDIRNSHDVSIAYTHTVFLPLLAARKPCDISGWATLNGVPVSGAVFSLGYYFVLGSYAPEVYSTTSATNGEFCFTSVPTLPCPGFFYMLGGKSVEATLPQGQYARSWGISGLQRCTPAQTYRDLQVELSDISIVTPSDDITVTIPVTFQWTHPSVETGYYEIQFGNCWDTIIAGYTNTVVMNQIPACVTAGIPITWWIAERSNGFVSSQIHTVTLQEMQ
jgi:hypothetical protein